MQARLVAYAPGSDDRLGFLAEPLSWQASAPLDDVGAIQISYSTLAQGGVLVSQALEAGLDIAVEVSWGGGWVEPDGLRFAVAGRSGDPADATGAVTITGQSMGTQLFGGNGALERLEADGQFAGQRLYADPTAGAVMRSQLDEWAARHAATPPLTWAFTATHDSNGVPWPVFSGLAIPYDAGVQHLGILADLVARKMCDWTTRGRELRLTVPAARDRSGVRLVVGRDIRDAPYTEAVDALAGYYLLRGEDGLVVTRREEVPPRWAMAERYLSVSGATTEAEALAAATTEIERGTRMIAEYTRGLLLTDQSQWLPWRDYRPGDMISAPAASADAVMRVAQITLSQDGSGLSGSVVLNDRRVPLALRTATRTSQALGGAVPVGTSAQMVPTRVTSAIAEALTSANGKGRNLYRSPETIGLAAPFSVHDTWYNTSDDYRMHRWSGSAWVDALLGTSALGERIITAAKLADEAVTAAKLAAEAVTPEALSLAVSALITNAQSTASAAQTTATSASSAASAAASSAASAAGIANGKGKALIQSAAPSAADQLAQNLWIDTTGGANTPKRWSGSAWVAVTDRVAIDAANAAATARTIADAAQTAADAAQLGANAAASAAAAAQTTADGKSKVTRSSATPSGGGAVGDQWWRYSGSEIIGFWIYGTSGWVSQTLTDAVITNLNAGSITAGSIAAARIAANTITGVHIASNTVAAANMVTGTITAASGVIADAAIGAAKIIDGSITNAKILDATIQSAKIASLDGGKITANSVTVGKLSVGALSLNMVPNGGFEDGLACWAQQGPVGGIAVLDASSGTPQSGSGALRITRAGTNRSVISTVHIPVTGGSPLAWRVTAATWSGRSELVLRLWWYTTGGAAASVAYTDVAQGTPGSGDWQWTTWRGRVTPPTNAATMRVEIYNRAVDGNLYVDDVMVTQAIQGDMIVDGAIDGKVITGATVRTAASGARVELINAIRVWEADNETITFEAAPGYVGAGGLDSGWMVMGGDGLRFWDSYDQYDLLADLRCYGGSVPRMEIKTGDEMLGYWSAIRIENDGQIRLLGAGDGPFNLRVDGTLEVAPTTTTTSSNATWVGSAGGRYHLLRSTSIRASKHAISDVAITPEDVLRLRPRQWIDKGQIAESGLDPDTATPSECEAAGLRWIPGLVAEEVAEVLPAFVTYDGDTLSGVAYDRLAVALLVATQDQERRLAAMEERLAALERAA